MRTNAHMRGQKNLLKRSNEMKEFFKDKSYGFFVTLALIALSIVTMIIYASIYGGTRFMSWAGFAFVIAGVVLSIALIAFKQYRWAPALLLAANFLGLLFYIYYIYFHVSVVLVGIQSAGFPPEFFVNAVFFVLTLIVSVVNVYMPQTKAKGEEK